MPVKKIAKRKNKLSVKIGTTVMPKSISTYTIKDKLKQPKVLIGLIVVILIVAAFFLKGLFIAAVVNGEPISRITIISELEKQGGKQILSSLVNKILILQEAKKKHLLKMLSHYMIN